MIATLSTLIGGLGLLLIGMNMMTEGLKLASGNALRDMLARWTNTRVRGLLTGLLVTGIVQSSSAVTVATIGFANAGMLTLERAVWVIYGSNVGTTLTAWVVAGIGFTVNIEALALPLVGLGALLKFTGGADKQAHAGIALVGFALLFLGIGVLKDTFEGLGADFTLPSWADPNIFQILVYVLAGMVLTTLMQSSTAAMVITLSAAQGGLIPLNAAAAVVIGTNLGTTSTALLSTLGATSTAKRVAVSHVAFNLLTATVAVFMLSPLLWLVQRLEVHLDIVPTPAMTLAVFHSIFNILGVLLMWPLSARLVRLLAGRFTSAEDSEANPRYIDHNVLALPYMATDALTLEVSRLNQHTVCALRDSLQHNLDLPHSSLEHRIVRKLADAIGAYAVQLRSKELTPFLSKVLADLVESTQQYLLVIDIAEDIAEESRDAREFFPFEVNTALQDYIDSINRHLDAQDSSQAAGIQRGSGTYDEVELYYRKLKDLILHSATLGNLSMEKVDHLLQYINQAKRACRQMLKATQRLLDVRELMQRDFDNSYKPATT
jgi:phosphate:Na+ symporter